MLTIGVVTIPFRFEKRPKILQALKGVDAIAEHVDALLVINNERLVDIYSGLTVNEGFAKVNEILTVAVKSIAELITCHGTINLDFHDVKKILKDGGVAVMSYGRAGGEHRLATAIDNALHSPLLNDNDVFNSKKILFNVYQSSAHPLFVQEIEELDQFMDEFQNNNIEVIWGLADDDSLGEDVKITVLATGFGLSDIPQIGESFEAKKRVETQQEETVVCQPADDASEISVTEQETPAAETEEPVAAASRSADERIDDIYGENFHTYTFSDDDLGNDALISAIAASPTFSRSIPQLKELQALGRA